MMNWLSSGASENRNSSLPPELLRFPAALINEIHLDVCLTLKSRKSQNWAGWTAVLLDGNRLLIVL